jgi:hypothetical protein
MSLLSKLFSSSNDEQETHHPVYEQPIVVREKPTYDITAKPTEDQESMMLDYALGHNHEAIEIELSNQGWVSGRNGWVKTT